MKSARKKNPCSMLKIFIAASLLLTVVATFNSSASAETYTSSYTYDLNGNIETRTTPNGPLIRYDNDELNRLKTVTYPDGKTVGYLYDGNGNRTSMTDWNGETSYVYDRFNRLREVWFPGINPVSYDYDKSGNLTKLTYPSRDAVSYEYDNSNRLWKVTDGTHQPTVYVYDSNNTTVYLKTKTLPNGVTTTYNYDAAKRITDVINRKSDQYLIASYHYEFDANGNRTRAVETTPAGSKTTDYTYDKLNRLKTATCSDDGTYENYDYDNSGNRLTKTTQNGTTTYEYDQDNRLNKIGTATGNTALFYDNNGNLTKKLSAGKTISYGYDYENRLISYTDGSNTITFGYDGDGNRISKTANGITSKYINDISSSISQVLLETDSQSRVTARYTYGDSRLSQLNHGPTSYYIYDNPGRSVVAVVNDSQPQSVLNSYAFDAFGNIKTSNETTPNDFLYAGEQYDDETGLIYLRKRYYDPGTGRFLSKDPFPGYVTQPQSVNPYPYVQNNPVNWIDPRGLKPGDYYATMDAAAIAALNDINPTSVAQSREYAGRIYKFWFSNGYSYTAPNPGKEYSSQPGTCFFLNCNAAYHTHGSSTPGAEDFSDTSSGPINDAQFARDTYQPLYLGTPSGVVKKLDPSTSTSSKGSVIGNCLK